MRWVVVSMLAAAAMAGAAAAVASSGFSALVYPPPVGAAPGHALALCPSPQGLEPFTPAADRLARRAAATYDRVSLATDLRNSDRSWWPDVRRMWESRNPGTGVVNQVVVGSEPADQSGFRVFMKPACGNTTLSESLMVTIGPHQTGRTAHCVACNSQLFFVDRRGNPLIYFLY